MNEAAIVIYMFTSIAHVFKAISLPPYPSVTGLQQPISATSLAWFVYDLIWIGLLLICFNGWGRFAGRLFRLERLPASVSCSLGIAAIVFLGGILNLAQAIDTFVIFLLVAIGVLLYTLLRGHQPEKYQWRSAWNETSPAVKLLLAAAILILLFRVAATVRLSSFDVTDDGSSYLVFPRILLAYHHFAPGPFSDRHIISSVGGGYWLQAFVISATSLANIGMADRTLGLVLLFAATWDVCIGFGLSIEQTAMLEFLVMLVPQPTANLTYVILPIALFLCLLWLIFHTVPRERGFSWRYALLAGVVGGATIALKSTFLPCVGSFVLVPYVVVHRRRKVEAFVLPVIAGVGAIIVLAAWMLAMNRTAGTLLFPILGHGLDHTNAGAFGSFRIARTPRTVIKLFLQAFVLLALALGALCLRSRDRRILFGVSVMIGAAVGITAFNLAAGGDSIWRYGFPQFFTAVLIYSIGLVAISGEASGPRKKVWSLALAIIPLIGCMFHFDIAGARPYPFRQIGSESAHYVPSLQASLSGRSLSSPALLSEYDALQVAIPRNGIAVENVAYPFLLNYKARSIYLMDWPGAAGPAPGWPFGSVYSVVAQYLRQNSVRYLIYDYRYAEWSDARSCQVLENPQRYSSELYVLFWMSLLAHHQLDALRANYTAIYDNGTIAVIDLTLPIEDAPADRGVWTVTTNKEEMCSAVMARYSANPLPGPPE